MTAATGIALAVRIRARRRAEMPALPSATANHEISTIRDRGGGEVYSVATCCCGWSSRVEVSELADLAVAIEAHRRDVRATAADGLAA